VLAVLVVPSVRQRAVARQPGGVQVPKPLLSMIAKGFTPENGAKVFAIMKPRF
jgi:hypothetical protein